MSIQIETVVVGMYQVNCYLVWDDSQGEGVIIDPGDEADLVKQAVGKSGFKPRGILLTHGHFDHLMGVEELRAAYETPVYAGKNELELLTKPELNGSALFGAKVRLATPEYLLEDEALVNVGPISFRVLATPGHSPGGVCYLHETQGVLFCGDTLFAQSIGRTDLPGGSMETLIGSIQTKIMKLPESVVCYPGHGPATTVGAEKDSNPFLNGMNFA